jgi:hypothetical protein
MPDASSTRDECFEVVPADGAATEPAKEEVFDAPDDDAPVSAPAPSQVVLKETRERRRSRRKRAVRAHTICVRRLSRMEIELGRTLYPDVAVDRPKTRADCEHGERPCPFVSCTHHLYLDVLEKTGAIKLNFPDLEVWEMTETCSLDVADRGGGTLEDVGAIVNLTRERIRQVEVTALAKLRSLRERQGLKGYADEGPNGMRRLPVLGARLAAAETEDDDREERELGAGPHDVQSGGSEPGTELDVDPDHEEIARELGDGQGRLKTG